MSSSRIDSLSSVYLPAQSPFDDYQETVISSFSDGINNHDVSESDIIWTNDDKPILTPEITPWPLPIFHREPEYPQRTTLLSMKRRMISDIPKSEPVVTKTNPFIFKDKDDNLWNEELPDTLLVSPRKENTPEPLPNDNALCNLDDDKTNLKLEFQDLFGDVPVDDIEVDDVTKEDAAFLDKLINDLNVCEPGQDLFANDTRNQVIASKSGSFNEISCNINQGAAADSDSQSAIKTLLKNESFQGNFAMKKSTEILSQIDRMHVCFTEHNYCSSTIPFSSTERSVPSIRVAEPVSVECILQDYKKVEPVISSPPAGSLNLKIPQIVLPQCSPSTCKSIPSPSSGKQIKGGKNHRAAVKKAKKTMQPKSTTNKCSMMLKDDPTYEPNSRNRRSSGKKIKKPKTKDDCFSAALVSASAFAPVTPSLERKVAKTPEVRSQSSFSCELKSSQRINVVKPRVRSPVAASAIPQFIGVVGKYDQRQPVVESIPVVRSNPPTPLASPTREDMTDDYDELKTQDSRQPETQCSNVDSTIVEPVQPSVEEAAPQPAKKKVITLQDYLKKRTPKCEPEFESSNSMADIVVPAPVPNVEEILKSIVKSEPLPAIPVTKASPTKKPAADKPPKPKPIARCEPIRNTASSNLKPIVKSQPRLHPETLKNRDDPKIKPAQPQDPIHRKSNSKPRSHPTTESKPLPRRPETISTPLKLTRIAIPERSTSAHARSNSLSPNETSQSSDSCDPFSSSGVSSYQNSSMSSACVSPVDEKTNDTKCSDSERIAEKVKPVLEIPFAVNKELLRKDDRSSKKYKRRRDKHRRSDSSSRKRKLSDSCYEDDSDCSDYSDRKRSRKRYVSSSSSASSERSYHHRSHTSEGSISPRPYSNGFDWYPHQQERVPEPYVYYQNFNEMPMQIPMPMPNMYYPSLPPPVSCPWPDYGPYYPTYGAPNMPVPYVFNGHPEPTVDAGEVEVDKRVLFVGNIEPDITEEEFERRFKKYGAIREVKLHFRENQNNFGFVYFAEERYVNRVIKHGCDDDDLPTHYKLGRGMKKERVADRRAFVYEKQIPVPSFPTPPSSSYHEDPYNLKLEQFKSDLRQKKFNDRYK
ncbi:serine/arginine repetitive matrix protein 2-like [Planococcus citri]|uniref:serine/arginine repetitive matrix protein 2-like n=1 Tax=Planococcus citri TaxID=170843 RepID=UPI0031F8D411